MIFIITKRNYKKQWITTSKLKRLKIEVKQNIEKKLAR